MFPLNLDVWMFPLNLDVYKRPAEVIYHKRIYRDYNWKLEVNILPLGTDLFKDDALSNLTQ